MVLLFVVAQISAIAQARSPVASPAPDTRLITIADSLSIFLQQNLQLVAARYDIDTAEAEKLTARLRPNPEIDVENSGTPVNFNGPIFNAQTFEYTLTQEFELGGKRAKRITVADANAALAREQLEVAIWQMTNDVKK